MQRRLGTPIGEFVVVATGKGVCALVKEGSRGEVFWEARKCKYFDDEFVDGTNEHIEAAEQWIRAYFSKKFDALPRVEFDLRGSEFELRVWKQMLKLPIGSLTTYSDLAKLVNCASAQAIGGACKRNPIQIIIPCHRILSKNNSKMTGYAGGGVVYKQKLLQHEL